MEDLIKALQIFLKYGNKAYPFHCEHDVLTVDYDPEVFSKKDIVDLDELGFFIDEEEGNFRSYKYGSC